MIDFDRLFELLEKADYASECGCDITTSAYLRIAQREAYDLVDQAETASERQRLLRGAQYVERKLLGLATYVESATFAWAFWRGFVNGWDNRTMPHRVSEAFKMGRRYGATRS